jgi:threonine synthase
MKNVTSAACISCGAEYEAGNDTYTCVKCGGILEVRYDYSWIKSRLNRELLKGRRDYSMWRYRELLPVEEDAALTPLRVGWSPLYRAENLGRLLGLRNLYIKDDGLNPTSSLKDRASAIAVVRAAHAGMGTVACSSTGNAASSLAGNAAAMGLESYIFVPERAPKGKVTQLLIFGAHVISVKGNYEETFKLSAEAIEKYGWYNRNAAINPYLSEGKKTVSLEIAEQLDITVPDFVAVSVGDGCTIAGVWKGFKDLYAAGLIE